jgi:hypothetical protein
VALDFTNCPLEPQRSSNTQLAHLVFRRWRCNWTLSPKRAAIEAKRLDEQEAPQREADLRRKQGEDNRVKQEKARRLNKPSFRP